MIKSTKQYTEDFALEVFNEHLKPDVQDDCKEFGFEMKVESNNRIVLAHFIYQGREYRILMDPVNAEISAEEGNTILWIENFAGLTDHFTFAIGENGIITENEYGYVFCEIYSHFYGLGLWISDAVKEENVDWDAIVRIA